YSDLTDDSVDIITDFTVGVGGDVLDLSAIHTGSIDANPDFTAGQEIYPYSHGYVRFIKSGGDTVVAYDVDGHGIDHTPQAVVILKNVNSLEFVKENHAVAGQNFNISRNGVIAEISEDDQSVTIALRLWGGQPSDDVTVSISLPDSSENSTQLIFTSGEWHQTKSVTFTKSADFDEYSLDNFSTVLSSNDLNYDGESLRYKTTTAENKSQIIGQIESQIDARYYAFEGQQDSEFSKVLQQNANDVVNYAIVQTGGDFVNGVVLEKNANNIILNATKGLPSGLYTFDVSYLDTQFNTAHEQISLDIKAENPTPLTTSIENRVVKYEQSLSEFSISDDGVIQSVQLVLGDGFSENLQVEQGGSMPASVSYLWNASTKIITLQGNVDAATYNDALHSLRINDLDTSTSPQKNISIIVEDYTEHGLFENTVQTDIAYIQGIEPVASVTYWNADRPIADVMMFSYAEVESDPLLEFRNIEFLNNSVSFDVYCGNNVQNVQNFDFSFLSDSFNLSQYSFSDKITGNNWFALANEVENGLSVSGVNTSNSISTGDMLLSIELNNISGKDIKSAFATFSVESVTLGQTSDDSIPIVGVTNSSNSSGEFADLSVLSGDHQFFLDKSIEDVGSFLNSYDALLALKIAALPDNEQSLNGSVLDPMQFIAADFNQNGMVTAADATAILKEIVGIEDSHDVEWMFLDKNKNYDDLARNNTLTPDTPNILIETQTPIEFTGVLTGDVDGSWQPDIL
ncbi:MAG TPA: type I secretion C-terminal target domain-containing protein, partial [Candidatus Thioglobus autotrophicus]|nr:type I secretion C-terminal target domain-containing protein [Candidatus Thioglobus autotrophicus]